MQQKGYGRLEDYIHGYFLKHLDYNAITTWLCIDDDLSLF